MFGQTEVRNLYVVADQEQVPRLDVEVLEVVFLDHVIECFGPDRVLYGGDWPVSELAGSYLQWLATLDWATAGFSPADKRKLFRDNAIKAYRLGAK